MAKLQVAQYRYSRGTEASNSTALKEKLNRFCKTDSNATTVFTGKHIVQLGIQGPSGVHFTLNGSTTHDLMIGSTGRYELNTGDESLITELSFSRADLATEHCSLIVDIIYWEG